MHATFRPIRKAQYGKIPESNIEFGSADYGIDQLVSF